MDTSVAASADKESKCLSLIRWLNDETLYVNAAAGNPVSLCLLRAVMTRKLRKVT